jgi:branched-chain amino acid transport system substrate-binding protein
MLTVCQPRTHWVVRLVVFGLTVCVISSLALAAPPKGAPKQFKLGFVDFFSGGAAIFGGSGKATTEWMVDKWNKADGIGGVPVKLIIVDEAGGPAKQVTEYRRLVLDEEVDAVLGYTSSANCLAIAPVAEELQTLTVVHICGTRRLTEENKLKYVFRTSNHQVADSVMAARYILSLKPDLKTIAGANEDYAWGRDSWDDFKQALLQLKPDVEVVGELWTKIQAGEYSAEISKLLAVKPEVIHSTFWGGGLLTFVKQANARQLFDHSLVIFPVVEQSFQDLKDEMPNGVVSLPRATGGYFRYPDPASNALQKEFVEAAKARYNRYPEYAMYRTYQALAGLKAAFEKAIEKHGRWPTTEEVIAVFETLTWQTPLGPVSMRADHQAVHAGIVGLSKFSPEYGFAVLDKVMEMPGDSIMPPVGMMAPEWLKTLH